MKYNHINCGSVFIYSIGVIIIVQKQTYSKIKTAVFWVVVPCSLVEVNQRFGGPCCLNFYQTTQHYSPEIYNYKYDIM
jgi:hypothetical protein